MVIKYDKNSFNDLISKETLILFYIEGCGRCRLMENTIYSISDFISVVLVDADKERALCKKYGVMSVPTLFYFKGGSYEKKNGYMSFDEMEKWLRLGDDICGKRV